MRDMCDTDGSNSLLVKLRAFHNAQLSTAPPEARGQVEAISVASGLLRLTLWTMSDDGESADTTFGDGEMSGTCEEGFADVTGRF